ncbi:MAG: hypothetical protein HY554_09505 [Elusimicrobia bacterium]|nr:hypothetical protein [Elusimicrobiota bacterium]
MRALRGSLCGSPVVPLAGAALYAALAWLAYGWSKTARDEPNPAASSGSAERVQEHAQASGGGGSGSQRITRGASEFVVEYGFTNFNQDALELSVALAKSDVDAAVQEFGFREKDFKALDDWYEKAQEGAIERTKQLYYSGKVTAPDAAALQAKLAEIKRRNDGIQAALDVTMADIKKEYRDRRRRLYADSGFRYKDEKTVEVDMPALVRRNARRMAPVSLAFSEIVQSREYGMEELVGAVTAMAQTSMRYEVPGSRLGDRTVGGVLPPPKSFVSGLGDCDTKTGVVGSVLLNWPNLKLVGLAIPGHYLLAVHRIPAKGEYYVEHQGLPYVMIEPAGPAWLPPGRVGSVTESYLKSGKLFAIQAF